MAYGLKDLLPSLIHGSANVESTLKRGQKLRFDGKTGTIKQAGAFQIIIENEEGKTVVIPTKMIADKEIIIESGPEPEIPEKKVERAIDEAQKDK
jgi:small-conductance mechanosensitive channel